MSRPRSRLIVGLTWAATIMAGLALLALASGMAGSELTRGGSWMASFGSVVVDVAVYATVGAVLTLKSPGNVIGRVLMAGGALVVTTFMGFVLGATLASSIGVDAPAAQWASFIGAATIYPAIIVAGPALAWVVPDGHLPGRRWRWLVVLIVALYVTGMVLFAGRPGPMGDSLGSNPLGSLGLPWVPGADALIALTLPIALVSAVPAVIIRFRRSRNVERQQLKWFVASIVVFAVLMFCSFADGASQPTVFDIAAFVSLSLPAVAIGMAVLRYRLYDIDRIISRTLAWGVITAILAAVFAVVVIVLQSLLAGLTQGQTLAVAASTLIAFALFQPIRRRVQTAVDRRFDRARYDGERIASAFGDRLRDSVELGGLESDVAVTVREALRPRHVGLWIRRGRPA